MPFVLDFEASDALLASDYDPSIWQLVQEGGQSLLIGTPRLNQPFVLLGREVPEWVDPNTSDFVVSFRFNVDAAEGVRLVFRYREGVGYNAIEFTAGRVFLRRNASNALNPLIDRQTERILRQVSTGITTRQWNDVTLWVEGARIYVYLNGDLLMSYEDLTLPQLGGGQIMFQGQNAFQAIRLDDIVVQRAEVNSDHFQGSEFPRTWLRSDSQLVTLTREGDGNQYIRLQGESQTAPVMALMDDVQLRCRFWSEEGGYQILLRESANGSLSFSLDAGNLLIVQADGAGNTLFTKNVSNFYTRSLWQDFEYTLFENRLTIIKDGQAIVNEPLEVTTPSGTLRFVARRGDKFRFDDCLLTQSATTSDAVGSFAYAVIERTEARTFRLLRSDLDETFNDKFRTDVWWEGGVNAAGEFATDPASANNQNFLRITHTGQPTYRLFRDNVGVEMFRAGNDTRNFSDSTDLLITLQMRLAENQPGQAWVGVRTSNSLTGNDIYGYRLTLVQNIVGDITAKVDYRDATTRTTFFEGAIPGTDASTLPSWIPITIVTYQDRMAFFVNDRFLTAIEGTTKFGGALALGVEQFTTADFDTLIIRDTTPHGGE